MASSRLLLLLLVLPTTTVTHSDRQYFNHFLQRFGKSYTSDSHEYEYRFNVFKVLVKLPDAYCDHLPHPSSSSNHWRE